MFSTLSQEDQTSKTYHKFLKQDSLTKAYLKNRKIDKFLEAYFNGVDSLTYLDNTDPMKLLFYRARCIDFGRMGLYRESIETGNKVLFLFLENEELKTKKMADLSWHVFAHIADGYAHFNELTKASETYKEAIKFVKTFSGGNLNIASANNNYGYFLSKNLKQYDSATLYLKKADNLMTTLPDSIQYLRGSIRNNLARTYYKTENYNEALELYYANFRFYNPAIYPKYVEKKNRSKPDYRRWLYAGLSVAQTEIQLENYSKAEKMLKRVDDLLAIYDFEAKPVIKLFHLNVSQELLIRKNKNDEAVLLGLKRDKLADSINRVSNAEKLIWNDQMRKKIFRQMKNENELKTLLLEKEKQNERFQLFIFIGILVFLMSTTLYLIISYKQRLKNSSQERQLAEQELRLTNLKNQLLNKQIDSKKRDLSDFALFLSENQKWIDNILSQFDQLEKLKGRAKGKKLIELKKLFVNKALFNETTKNFEKKIDKLSSSFYNRLLSEYPDLTSSEVKLSSMIRLGIDNFEIATLHNIHPNSVHQSRYRLKKKLNLDSAQDLNSFLNNF